MNEKEIDNLFQNQIKRAVKVRKKNRALILAGFGASGFDSGFRLCSNHDGCLERCAHGYPHYVGDEECGPRRCNNKSCQCEIINKKSVLNFKIKRPAMMYGRALTPSRA